MVWGEAVIEVRLPFGLRCGKLIHISLVERGLACGCSCPGCGVLLVAKKGSTAHHFAHHVSTVCDYSPETALHNYAKQLIANEPTYLTPSLVVVVSRPEYGIKLQESLPEETLSVVNSWVELACEDVVPDVQLDTEAGRHFAEVAVTNFSNQDKRQTLRRIGLPAVELKLDDVPADTPLERIHAAVLDDMNRRSWLFHPQEAEIQARLNAQADAQVLVILRNRTPVPDAPRVPMFSSLSDYEPWQEELDETSESVVAQAKQVEAEQFDAFLRAAPQNERATLYALFEPEEKLAYNCFLMKLLPEMLPKWFLHKSYEAQPFVEPAIVWRTGVVLRFMAKQQGRFVFTDVVAWCVERYPLNNFAQGLIQDGDGANWSMTHAELAIFRWLQILEEKELLESDQWIPRRRQYSPTGNQLPVSFWRVGSSQPTG